MTADWLNARVMPLDQAVMVRTVTGIECVAIAARGHSMLLPKHRQWPLRMPCERLDHPTKSLVSAEAIYNSGSHNFNIPNCSKDLEATLFTPERAHKDLKVWDR